MNGRLHELVTQLLVHHRHESMQDAPVWARALFDRMGAIIHNQEHLMLDTTQLGAQVARLQASDSAALALLQHLKDQNNDLATQLANLPKNDDTAVQAQIDQMAKTLSDQANAIDAAVAGNPATPNLQPSPSESPTPAPAAAPSADASASSTDTPSTTG